MPQKAFPTLACAHVEHPALPPVSRSYSGAWGRSVTHYSPVRHSHPGSKLPGIPFDLHVLSTPPAFILSQNRTLHKKPSWKANKRLSKRKKTDHPCKAKNGHTKNPDTHQTPSGTTRAGIGLAIKNHKPHPHGCDPWQVVQYTLLSSQTTKHTHNPDPEEPDQTASGSKRKTYTTTPTNTTHRRVATHKTQQPQHLHRRVTNRCAPRDSIIGGARSNTGIHDAPDLFSPS